MDIAEIDKLPCAQRFSKRVILKVAEIVDVSVHPGGSFLYVLIIHLCLSYLSLIDFI